MKIAIGFDSGLANCGYGVVARGVRGFVCLAHGSIRTNSKASRPERLLKIYQHATDLITEWKPSKISIESVYWNRNKSSCLPIAEVIGILQLAAAQKEIEVVMLSPQSVKSAVTGVSGASKTQVIKMTHKLLGMKEPVASDHAADALGCAIAAFLSNSTPSVLQNAAVKTSPASKHSNKRLFQKISEIEDKSEKSNHTVNDESGACTRSTPQRTD